MTAPAAAEPAPGGWVARAVQRGWLTLVQVPLLLPYLTFTQCGKSTSVDVTGIELYFSRDFGPIGLVVLVVLALLWVFAWGGDPDGTVGVTAGLRAFVAGVGALLVIIGPSFAFLFDQTVVRVGWWLHGAGWALTVFGYLSLGIWALVAGWGPIAEQPRPRSRIDSGVTLVLAGITPLAVAVNPLFNEPQPEAIPWLLLAGWTVTVPLTLTGIGLGRARRAGLDVRGYRLIWLIAAAHTVAVHLLAAVAD